jgi:hypothetical protein
VPGKVNSSLYLILRVRNKTSPSAFHKGGQLRQKSRPWIESPPHSVRLPTSSMFSGASTLKMHQTYTNFRIEYAKYS